MASINSSLPPPVYEPQDILAKRASPSSTAPGSPCSSSRSYSNSISLSEYEVFPDDLVVESLPAYTPALTKKGILQLKPELSSPFCRANRRNWRSASVEVNNTQLKLTQSDWIGLNLLSRTTTYSLQFAEVGLASDYTKRPYCFRLRVETKQFVFDCRSREQMLGWMVSLQMAISLALPLELRQMPDDTKRRLRRSDRRGRHRRRRERDREGDGSQSASGSPSANDSTARRTSSSDRSSRNDESASRSEAATSASVIAQVARRGQHRFSRKKHEEVINPVKWQPARRQSRFSEKDFPHLFVDTTWEGRNVLYRGQWALVQDQQIILLVCGPDPPLPAY